MFKQWILIIFSLFIFSQNLVSQHIVSGRVLDESTNQGVPYAAVACPATGAGTITDFDGIFEFQSVKVSEFLVFSCIGYVSDTLKISGTPTRNIEIRLQPANNAIDEVVVHAGENPANILLKKVIKAKKQNDPKNLDSYTFTQYTKAKLSITNISDSVSKENFQPEFRMLYDIIDTSDISGKTILPVMLTESFSEFYYKRFPERQKEIVKAVKFAGFKDDALGKYTGQMYVDNNFYENFMQLFEKEFTSPISATGLLSYEYYLTDSTFIDGQWCYRLKFKPRRKSEYTFTGYMWIADSVFALKYIEAELSPGANINYVKHMKIKQDFSYVSDSLYFLSHESFYVEFVVSDKVTGFSAEKDFYRDDITVNPEFPDKFFSPTVPREVITEKGASEIEPEFWKSARYQPLEAKEAQIYTVADSIQTLPQFEFMKNWMYFGVTGYWRFGKFEYGPVFQSFSKNEIEGNRFRFGIRTSNDFSKKVELGGHVAYGTLDKTFKYSTSFKYKFQNAPWTIFKMYHKNDMTELGVLPYAFSDGNFLADAFTSSLNDNLFRTVSSEIGIEHQFFQGFTTELFFSHRETFPTTFYPFTNSAGQSIRSLTSSEFVLNGHLAINEEYAESVFSRMSLGTKYPMIDFSLVQSLPNVLGNDYDYTKIELNFDHNFYIGPLGRFNYRVGAGKIFGTVPYPLLKLHPGNETIFSELYVFNLMNIYEFASNEYAHVFIYHHFNGLFLNKVPLLRKLKAREFVTARGVIGTLSDADRNEFQFPSDFNTARTPYLEVGVGVENILNYIQIEAVWRVTHTENIGAENFKILFALVPNL